MAFFYFSSDVNTSLWVLINDKIEFEWKSTMKDSELKHRVKKELWVMNELIREECEKDLPLSDKGHSQSEHLKECA